MDSSIIDGKAIARLDTWGGSHLVSQMIRLFLKHSAERLRQIRSALEDEPGELPERGAHELKSSAANLGAVRIVALASEVEEAARGRDFHRVQELLPDLEAAVQQGCAELEPLLEG